MEKIKTILFTVLAVLLSVFTLGFINKRKKEAIKEETEKREKIIVEFEELITKQEEEEKKDDETKDTQEISNDVDDLLDDDF